MKSVLAAGAALCLAIAAQGGNFDWINGNVQSRAGTDPNESRFVMTPKKNDEYGVEVGILARNYPPRPSLDFKAESGRFATGGIR